MYLAKKGARRSFAIKKVTNTKKDTARQEITILKSLDHPCIIKYYDHFMEGGVMCLVLEYADKGTFEQQVKAGRLDRREWCVWRFIGHIAAGLEYLHNMEILNMDLKPDNILGFNSTSGPGEQGTALGAGLKAHCERLGLPPVTRVVSSPLLRCVQTAAAAAAQLGVKTLGVEPGLAEGMLEEWYRSWGVPGADST